MTPPIDASGGEGPDLLAEAESRFRALRTYRVTLQSVAGEGERLVARYFFRKPGWVRMELVEPWPGVVLIYAPETARVRVWPLGLGFPSAPSVAPDHPMVCSARGHRIDRSDVGALFARLRALRAGGRLTTFADPGRFGAAACGIEVVGTPGADGVARNRVWLADDTLFPLRVESFDPQDALIERVDMIDAELDAAFSEGFFTP